jgi:hypothetical protein
VPKFRFTTTVPASSAIDEDESAQAASGCVVSVTRSLRNDRRLHASADGLRKRLGSGALSSQSSFDRVERALPF